MKKYKILWLDDYFSSNTDFSSDVDSYESQHNEFKIKKVSNFKDFEYEIKKADYDGVILDIFGDVSPDQTENRNRSLPFYKAIDLLKKERILKIAYSGKVSESEEKDSLKFQAENAGVKLIEKGKMDIPQLFDEEVKPRLEDKFIRDFPDYLEIEGLLPKEVALKLNEVKAMYNENVDKSAPFEESDFDNIRKLIEAIFKDWAVESRIITTRPTENNLSGYLDLLSKKCSNKFVKPALNIIREFSNPPSHFNTEKVSDYPGYGRYVFHALFNELFMCLKWFCSLLSIASQPPVGDGIVEVDEAGNVHVGNVLLPSKATYMKGCKLHKDFEFDPTPIENTAKTKDKYPWYAKYKRLP